MRILVCGSRTFSDDWTLDAIVGGYFQRLDDENSSLELITGDATGADAIARSWADVLPVKVFAADWATHGKAAGPMRNKAMIEERPDLVLAFIDKPLRECRGTSDTIRRAYAAGIDAYVIEAHFRRNESSPTPMTHTQTGRQTKA